MEMRVGDDYVLDSNNIYDRSPDQGGQTPCIGDFSFTQWFLCSGHVPLQVVSNRQSPALIPGFWFF